MAPGKLLSAATFSSLAGARYDIPWREIRLAFSPALAPVEPFPPVSADKPRGEPGCEVGTGHSTNEVKVTRHSALLALFASFQRAFPAGDVVLPLPCDAVSAQRER